MRAQLPRATHFAGRSESAVGEGCGTLLAPMKQTCCQRYKKKGKACKKCPTVAALTKKQAKKLLEKNKH